MRKINICFLVSGLMMLNAWAKNNIVLKPNLNNPDHLLLIDQFDSVAISHVIKTHFTGLNLNIYLSGLKQQKIEDAVFTSSFFSAVSKANYLESLAIYKVKAKKFDEAILNFQQAYEISLPLNNNFQSFVLAYNLAYLFYFKNDITNADLYNSYANDYLNGLHKPKQSFDQLLFASKIATSKNEIEKAENLILKNALPISGKLGQKSQFTCYLQLGKIYLRAKRFTESKWFFIQANTTANKIDFKEGEIASLILLSKVKVMIKDYDLALQDLQKAQVIIEEGYPAYKEDLALNFAIVNKNINK
ncbi:hypothetical protein I5M32_03180 [Pedobacter sp. SD-b]|uniref:Tetratricopeptide repeat-containing protein n=1 Tax=Pedobacter segetis TaxID=2793069 RepID=A0ABS1BGN1_9SPHI|nr:hypothetical protein [Pedobacter segetis]MBK0381951.1 hypothetical protein [Pedobacter segetis]